MPLPLPSRTPSGPRRRSLLASAAGAALLVGCSSGTEESEERAGGSPSAVERARARAARDSGALVARYDAVLAVHPALAGRLEPLRAEAVRHVEAFGGAGKASPSATGSATGSPASPDASSTSTASAPPADPSAVPSAVPIVDTDALAGLAAAERALADRRATELLDVPGELARLLASVAAAGAAHAYLLTEETR
ncbi:hypothetical protein [Streptomyces rishiriensis]|uniref:Lipoprotein n=1 Tax=Streptomyces rishiriensis TaxID=68264 RepID=A0ABU0NZE8_STRRH|nr:hypothetical protein [Streptomyces rishiriensis]MDQ0583810.1 hypothetical protein [Streptomyces rishiriensis]